MCPAENFRPLYNPKQDKVNQLWNIVLLTATGNLACCIVTFSAHYFLFPTDPAYPVYFFLRNISLPSFTRFTVYITFGVAHTYFIFRRVTGFMLLANMNISLVIFFWGILKTEFRTGQKGNNYKTVSAFRSADRISVHFRALQLVMRYFNNSLSIGVPIAHALVMLLSMYCQVLLIKYGRDLPVINLVIIISTWLIGEITWMFTLHAGATLTRNSTRCIGSWTKYGVWSTKKELVQMRKFRKSCCPLAIRHSTFFVIRRASLLGFLRLVTRYTFKALLTVK